ARREGDAPPAKARAVLPVEFLKPNPNQPRRHFDEAAIEELAHSIRARGLLQPILVRPLGPESYEIVAGERRWRAAQKAQLHEVPVVIRDLSEQEAAEIALIENVQRVDLNPVEEARAYERLIEVYKRTPEQVAKAVGKSRSHIANSMRLLTSPPAIMSALEKGEITAGHARAMIGAPKPDELLKIVLSEGLSVREVEDFVRRALDRAAPRQAAAPPASAKGGRPAPSSASANPFSSVGGRKDADTRALEEAVASALGMLVTIEHGPKGDGMIGIAYRDLDQLDEIVRRLTGARI
ncbi:MAG: ParB/RepB/Spo0J family partition protein, partial [Parvularculaceae bacterium]|nr:ParB/RepB/Spo0J family partition protein [Parvularculaceae bacterium]